MCTMSKAWNLTLCCSRFSPTAVTLKCFSFEFGFQIEFRFKFQISVWIVREPHKHINFSNRMTKLHTVCSVINFVITIMNLVSAEIEIYGIFSKSPCGLCCLLCLRVKRLIYSSHCGKVRNKLTIANGGNLVREGGKRWFFSNFKMQTNLITFWDNCSSYRKGEMQLNKIF